MHIVIIGNGIAGSTAARFIRKWSGHKITMISDEGKHPFSRTALMYIFMGHLNYEGTKLYEDNFWEKNNIKLKEARVNAIDKDNKSLTLNNGETINYDKLIIASGSKPNKFGWPGQDLKGVTGLYHMQDLKRLEEAHAKGVNRAVIVGGGLIGIELAEMLSSRGIPVTFLVRESSFWDIVLPKEESSMINRHILAHGIDVRFNTEITEIIGTDHVTGVKLKSGETIECEIVGLTVGVSPNVSFLKESGLSINRGISVNEHLSTSDPNIYAIGDCAELQQPKLGRRPIEAIWYTGRMMGQTVAHTICKSPVIYNPGIWFNSAKFLDIEYQVYGYVPNKEEEGVKQLYWQHPTENIAVRIVYDENKVLGFNLMGVRYRHEVCEKWIKDETPIEEVLTDLSLANFDPEFFKEYEQELIELYNKQHNTTLRLRSKRSLNRVHTFLNKLTNYAKS